MKKMFLVLLTVCVLAACFTACGPKSDETIPYIENVSHYQTHAYRADTEEWSVEISAGRREKDFRADGKVGETADFQLVKISPKSKSEAKELDFVLTYSGGEISAKAQKDRFGPGYSAYVDVGEGMDGLEKIKIGDSDAVELENLLADKIGWTDAFKVATEELKDFIAANLDESGNFKKEICVKYLLNPYDGSGEYYWYVAFMGEGFDYTAILIDPTTGKIVSK